jgi:hypothetical protein
MYLARTLDLDLGCWTLRVPAREITRVTVDIENLRGADA